MKKIRIALIISIVTVLLFSPIIISSIFNNSQTSNMQTPTPTTKPITNVHITNFYFEQFFPAEGLSWHCGFVIEVTNNETQRADELSLTFDTQSPYSMNRTVGFYNNTLQTTILPQKYVDMEQPCFLGPLDQGETKVLHGYIKNNLGDSYRVRGYDFVVELRNGDTVLDQATIMIPGPTLPPD